MNPKDIQSHRLYNDLAYLMPMITPPEEYAEEAAYWRSVLREKLGEGRHSILELGVGGGHNLSHLAPDFEATAVDISEAMLVLCRKLNPEVRTHCGDMRSVRLGKTFAAVLIHDAINYMRTEADLADTFRTAAAHLEKGGLIIVSPDRFQDSFQSPDVDHATHRHGDTQVTYVEFTYAPDPNGATLEIMMTFYIESPEGLRIEMDRHHTGLFPKAAWLRLMQEAGFSVEEKTFSLKNWPHPYVLLTGVFEG
jgi:SAM-dependent methyltransferase